MLDVEFLPGAQNDVDAGYAWYRNHDRGAAIDFVNEVESASLRVRRDPDLGPRIDREHRFYRLRRFPYYLVYRIESTNILIVAVSHNRRDPSYWQGR